MIEFFQQSLSILDSSLRIATPLIFCAMAGIFSERSGIIDIGLEGKMLLSAFVAALVTYYTGSPWIGLIGAIFASGGASLVHGFACITNKGDQVISGLAINILASGITITVGIALFSRGGQTPPLKSEDRFMPISLPFEDTLANLPILGEFYAKVISGHNVLVYIALLIVALTFYVIFKTSFGLRLRAVGEKPEAIDTAGISVDKMRYQGVIIAGILCGFAGAYLSIAHGAGFGREMSAGKGYIALAAMIFGKWNPLPTLFACFLFGFLEALATRLQGVEILFIGEVPVQFMQALPYLLTIILLAGFIGKARAPSAIGIPYTK